MARSRLVRGFNLPELMIALTLGLFLVAAFLIVLQRSRAGFAANESLARLHDASRHALSVLVSDVEHAGFYGFTRVPAVRIAGSLPAGIHACGQDFAVQLSSPAQGSDNGFRPGEGALDCAPTATADGARASSDTLTLRHASQNTTAPRAGRLQVYSRGLASTGPLLLFGDGRAPGPVDSAQAVRDLEVRTYYVANSSVDRPGWPALRVKALTESRGAAQFRDEEILPGVEDLQVEFGVASIAADGTWRVHFVAADSPRVREGVVVAVRLWLRILADITEPGFNDDRTLTYANVTFTPSRVEAKHRRTVIERTVALRNVQLP
ncbi:MAG TPA: PilW family protein [Steroidobacteraceae bacterium]|nr:PilW family protein [Steroidobacteraceae bacterium]